MVKAKTVQDVSAQDFITAFAAHLKKGNQIEVPAWTEYAKTAALKELGPYNPDWFLVRTASIARRIYLRPGTGVGSFKKVYGTRNKPGMRPAHFRKASGSIIRHALQQLEKSGLVEKDNNGGRRITKNGQSQLDQIASSIDM